MEKTRLMMGNEMNIDFEIELNTMYANTGHRARWPYLRSLILEPSC